MRKIFIIVSLTSFCILKAQNIKTGGIFHNHVDGGIEIFSGNDDTSYIDFKGINNVDKDYVGRILYNDVRGMLFIHGNFPEGDRYMSFLRDGNVGIGTINPDERLTVKGKIHAEEVKVDLQVPADYVFQKYYTGSSTLKSDYKLLTLQEIEEFTKEHHHLPSIPSGKEIQEKGLDLGEISNLLLQKIEELTLYTIEQQKQIEELKKKLEKLEK